MKYKIEYLPKAVDDLESIVHYIVNSLNSPQSTNSFIELLNEKILKLESYPQFYKIYEPYKKLNFVYRKIIVKNYIVFYTIVDNRIEIHRILYGKMICLNI